MQLRSRMPVDPQLRDAGKRAADVMNGYYAAHDWDDLKNKYVAVRLSDGGTDGNLYDTRREAVRHQSDGNLCAYPCFRNLGPAGANARDMSVFLQMQRNAYDSGNRLTDPDEQWGGREIVPTSAQHDLTAPGVHARIAAYTEADLRMIRETILDSYTGRRGRLL